MVQKVEYLGCGYPWEGIFLCLLALLLAGKLWLFTTEYNKHCIIPDGSRNILSNAFEHSATFFYLRRNNYNYTVLNLRPSPCSP